MATKQRRGKQNRSPLGYIGVIAVVISLAVLGIQLNNEISLLVGGQFGGAAVGDNWWDTNWQNRIAVNLRDTDGIIHNNNIAEFTLSNVNSKPDCSDIRVVSLNISP